MNKDVTIIGYGSGNILSIRRAFEEIDCKVNVATTSREILAASRLVLPGVGAFPNGMQKVHESNLVDSLNEARIKGTPILGICLGMQMLFCESSEFTRTNGLNYIPGRVTGIRELAGAQEVRSPRIGWFELTQNKTTQHTGIMEHVRKEDSFYFVHSFMAYKVNQENLVATTQVTDNLLAPAIVASENVFGFQFHPEKSGKAGLNLLQNFVRIQI